MHIEIRKYFERGVDVYLRFRLILRKDETKIINTLIGALGGNRTHDFGGRDYANFIYIYLQSS